MLRAVLLAAALLLVAVPSALADRFALADPPPFAAGEDVVLTGTVTTQDGVPVAGRTVALRGRPEASDGALEILRRTTADSAGAFRFTLRISEPYYLQAGDGGSDWGAPVTAAPRQGGGGPGGGAPVLTLDAVPGAVWPGATRVSGRAPAGTVVRIEGLAHPYRGRFTPRATVTAGPGGRFAAAVRLDRRTRLRAVPVAGGAPSAARTATLVPRVAAVTVVPLPRARFQVTVQLSGPPALRVGRAYVYMGPVTARRLARLGAARLTRTAPGRYRARRTVRLPSADDRATVRFCFPLPDAWAGPAGRRIGTAPAQGTTAGAPAEVRLGRCGATLAA